MSMIEVFKTDVEDKDRAAMLVEQIHRLFAHCRANFDLDDCDRILRVKGIICESDICQIINLMQRFGHFVQILPDDDASYQDEVTAGVDAFFNM
jgi:hypothetical protein